MRTTLEVAVPDKTHTRKSKGWWRVTTTRGNYTLDSTVASTCLVWAYRCMHIILSARVSPRAGLPPPQRRASWRLLARGAAARALQAARSPPTQPPMEEAPVTRRLVVQGKERTFSASRRRQEVV